MERPHQQKANSSTGMAQTLRRIFFVEKLHNTTGIILLTLFAIIIAYNVTYGGIAAGLWTVAYVGLLPLIYSIIAYPRFGVIVLIIMAYMVFVLYSLIEDIAFGTVLDTLQVLLFLTVMVKIKNEWAIFKSPITVVILIWLGYNLLEVANPGAASRMAWVYTVREVAIVSLSYFIFMYNIRTVKFIRVVFITWIILTIIGAAYGFKQEYIGFTENETKYLNSEGVAALLFIDGHWRKFSIFSDPVAFAYNMVMPSIFCICLIMMDITKWKRIALIGLIFFFLDAMLFSGTRGANVLLPAALFLLAILKFNKKVLIFTAIAGLFLAFLIMVPTSNPNLYRFQTAFRPNNDDSYNLRKANQKRIQPYIVSHPLGGGLGATGEWGQRFSPGSYLANFPPDSGYIRVAVEDGWIGLLIFCTFMFVIIKTGINNYYLIQDPELKTYCLAMTMIIFAYNLANFPQEALVQFPSNIMFFLEAALINITLRLDIALKEERNVSQSPELNTGAIK
jgi:putative inorganic carbon (HCO3(-)) transporter